MNVAAALKYLLYPKMEKWIAFRNSQQPSELSPKNTFKLSLFRPVLGIHYPQTHKNNILQRLLFVRGIAFHGFHHVTNQIVASLQKHTNNTPPLFS